MATSSQVTALAPGAITSGEWEAYAQALCNNRKSPVHGHSHKTSTIPTSPSILSINPTLFPTQLIEDVIKESPTPLSDRQLVVINKCNKDIRGDDFIRLTRILIIALAVLPILMPLAIDPSSSSGLWLSSLLAIGTGLVFFELGEKKSDIAQEALREKEKIYKNLCDDFNQNANNFLYNYVKATPFKDIKLSIEDFALLTNNADPRITKAQLKGAGAKFKLKAQQLHGSFSNIEAFFSKLNFTDIQISEMLKPLKCAIVIVNPELTTSIKIPSFYLDNLKLVYETMRRDIRTDLIEEIRTRKQAPGTNFIDVD